ncbi:hypothetical protein COC49_16665 [Bacillus cereus]|nr:hypothetical protein COC49_16665 [Bacillus cereus]
MLDSTTFQLPDKFSSHYQGSGGSSHTAGVKIQLEYDLLSGKFLQVYVGEGRENDKTFASTSLQAMRPKDLCIRDLGYFDLHDLQKIHEKETSGDIIQSTNTSYGTEFATETNVQAVKQENAQSEAKKAQASGAQSANASYGTEFATETDVHAVKKQNAKSATKKSQSFSSKQ